MYMEFAFDVVWKLSDDRKIGKLPMDLDRHFQFSTFTWINLSGDLNHIWLYIKSIQWVHVDKSVLTEVAL